MRKNPIYRPVLMGIGTAAIIALVGYLALTTVRLQKKVLLLEKDSSLQKTASTDPNNITWETYTYKGDGKNGFTISVPATHQLLEQKKLDASNQIKHFAIFDKKAVLEAGTLPIMTIEFFPENGQISFSSEKDSEWDRLYHNRIIRSLEVIPN